MWAREAPPVRDCDALFRELAQHGIDPGWIDRWIDAGLPDKECPSISFEDRDERWPNPIALLFQKSLWQGTSMRSFSVPQLTCHGDLNPQNVLCPNVHRQAALRIQSDVAEPIVLLKHISVIDPPFCFSAPFTYDPAFLLVWLQRVLLPPFTSQSNVDVALSTYDAVLREIALGLPPQAIDVRGHSFANCAREIWGQVSYTNLAKQEDLRDAFLTSLAAANIWQAIKAFGKAREEAIGKICMASMSLKLLMGQKHLAKPDFELWLRPRADTRRKWTSTTRQIGTFLGTLSSSSPVILVIGSKWADRLNTPSDEQVRQLATLSPRELQQKLAEISPLSQSEDLSALGRLPTSLVLDYSYFNSVSESLAQGLPNHRSIRQLHPDDKPLDSSDMHSLFFLSLRGTLRYPDTLVFDAKGRSRIRRGFRPFLESFQRCHGAKAQVVIVGATSSEMRETIAYLGELWAESLHGICIGASDNDREFLADWGIQSIPGGIDDLVTASLDLAVARAAPTIGSAAGPAGPTLVVSGIRLSDNDIVIDKLTEELTHVSIPPEDADAFARAGCILSWDLLDSFSQVDRDPKQFFVGHRVLLAEVHRGIPIKRNGFDDCLHAVEKSLEVSYPQVLPILSRPGAGASTLLVGLAYEIAFKQHIPTLILHRGGQHAFEAIERLHRLVKRTFLVVADPEDVSAEEVRMLKSRCAPSQYPATFLTSIRTDYDARRKQRTNAALTKDVSVPILPLELDSGTEREQFLRAIARYCPGVRLASLASSPATSFFLLSLDAFGGERIDVDRFVTHTMSQGSRRCNSSSRRLLSFRVSPTAYARWSFLRSCLIARRQKSRICWIPTNSCLFSSKAMAGSVGMRNLASEFYSIT